MHPYDEDSHGLARVIGRGGTDAMGRVTWSGAVRIPDGEIAVEHLGQPRDVVGEVAIELPPFLESQLSRSVRVGARPVPVAEADLLEVGRSPVRPRADVSQGALVDPASVGADVVMKYDEQLIAEPRSEGFEALCVPPPRDQSEWVAAGRRPAGAIDEIGVGRERRACDGGE